MRSLSSQSASSSSLLGHGLEVIGAIHIGGAVDVGRRRAFEKRKCAPSPRARALEHHVLEQVREAGAARRLVRRPTSYHRSTATSGAGGLREQTTVSPLGSV